MILVTGRAGYIGSHTCVDLFRSVFARFEIEAVIHFAGLKAVGESVAEFGVWRVEVDDGKHFARCVCQ